MKTAAIPPIAASAITQYPCRRPDSALERFFSQFRKNIIGNGHGFDSPVGHQEILYADWTASGRAYQPIEACIQHQILPFLANTHTQSTITGTLMSKAYEEAKRIVKDHVHANHEDVLIFCGSGMTAAVTKLQRLLGLRIPERAREYVKRENTWSGAEPTRSEPYLTLDEELRPVVFVTHMEHHSNHISWLETLATVEIIPPDTQGQVDIAAFRRLLTQFKNRKHKIAAVTACSNVTGVQTPYHEIAKLIHEQDGFCFVDFAASAPYVAMDMHPEETGTYLDAIYFSPHKFLGGPGTSGVLIFNQKLYKNCVPDQPGGGTVMYTNPWNDRTYITDIEQREDGGTPPILQGIKVAMCIRLKEAMGIDNIQKREEELLEIVFDRFATMKQVQLLAGDSRKRLGIVSFMVSGAHYNLIVKLLNDRFGIQTRGGCSCAGPYGHWLLGVDRSRSYKILNSIRSGDLSCKPGWIRLSIHPTMTNAEIHFILDAIDWTASHYTVWMGDYTYNPKTNDYSFRGIETKEQRQIENWFTVSRWG